MSLWVAIAGVGLGSLAMRILPQFVRSLAEPSPLVEDVIRQAGLAALTALVVTSGIHAAATSTSVGVAVALAVGSVLAVRGRSMLAVVAAGMAVVWSVSVVVALV